MTEVWSPAKSETSAKALDRNELQVADDSLARNSHDKNRQPGAADHHAATHFASHREVNHDQYKFRSRLPGLQPQATRPYRISRAASRLPALPSRVRCLRYMLAKYSASSLARVTLTSRRRTLAPSRTSGRVCLIDPSSLGTAPT